MRFAIQDRETGAVEATYEADAPRQDEYGGPWGDPAKFEHVEHVAGVAERRALQADDLRRAGFARVHRDYPPFKQRRLAFKAATDAERKACAALIESVKAAVDAGESAIAAAQDAAAMDTAIDTALADIAAL